MTKKSQVILESNYDTISGDEHSESPLTPEPRLRFGATTDTLFRVVGAVLLLVTAYLSLINPSRVTVQDLLWQQPLVKTVVIVLFIGFVQPRVASALLLCWTAWYLIALNILPQILLPAVYAGLLYLGSWFAAKRLGPSLFPSLVERHPGFCLNLASIIFLSITPAIALATLVTHTHYSQVLFSIAGIFVGITWISGRRYLSKAAQPRSADAEDSHILSFLNFCLIGLLVAAAIFYLYPDSLIGDENKSYASFPRYFSLENSFFLEKTGYVRNLMIAFHHTQELFLTAGYTLGKNFGLKLYGVLLVLLKFQALSFLARSIFGFSQTRSKAFLLAFATIPIVVELHAGIRPENMLTICGIYFVYFLESACRERRESGGVANRNWGNMLLIGVWMACLGVSIKLTGLYLLAAAALVYHREWLAALGNLKNFSRYQYTFALCCLAVLNIWFVRNLIRFGTWGNMKPFDKYHLTILFPPIRSLDRAWEFVSSSLIFTSKYTEYVDFGYGFFGFLLLPGVFFGLAARGAVRRTALYASSVLILLLCSTVQIRYLAPIVPFFLLVLFVPKTFAFIGSKHAFPGNVHTRRVATFLFVLLLAASSALVNNKMSLAVVLNNRIAMQDKNLENSKEPFKTINNIVKFPESIMVTYNDHNYSTDAILVRSDPITSLANVVDIQEESGASHWMAFKYDLERERNYFFNDLEFLESIADPITTATAQWDPNWTFFLYRHNSRLFERVVNYVKEKGWKLDETIIVSHERWSRFPFELRLGEELNIPGLKHRLFRLKAQWNQEVKNFYYPSGKASSQDSLPSAFYMEDTGIEHPAQVQNRLQVAKSSSKTQSANNLLIPATIEESGVINYRIVVPEAPQLLNPVLDVFVQGLSADSSNQATLINQTDGSSYPIALSTKLAWHRIAVIPVVQGETQELSFQISAKNLPSSIGITGIRLILDSSVKNVEGLKPLKKQLGGRPYGHLFTLGSPLDHSVEPLWVFENFKEPLRKNTGRLKTVRESIGVKESAAKNRVMTVTPAGGRGRKIYRFELPTEYYSDLVLKLFIGQLRIPVKDSLTITVRDPNANPTTIINAPSHGVYFSRKFDSQNLVDTLTPIAEVPIAFVASAATKEQEKVIEVEVEMDNNSAESIGLDELMIIIGRHLGEV